MESEDWDTERSVMKSIDMEVQGCSGMGRGWSSPNGRWRGVFEREHVSHV